MPPDNATTTTATTTPMSDTVRRWLTTYLLVATAVAAYGILSLWTPGQSPGQVPAKDCTGVTTPALSNIYPSRIDVGSAIPVLLIGCAFPTDTQVKFNGVIHGASVVDPSHIHIDLTTADVAVANIVKLTLSSQNKDYANGLIAIAPATISWRFFGVHFPQISLELQLLLLVLFSGALGSSVYAIKSLGDYEGAGKLYDSWTIFYFIQPFEGAGIAMIFYFAIRGGFLVGTGADVKAVNPFGICAIAALAGAFSDMAFAKLREVFETLFKPTDNRPGKIEAPKITTTSLPSAVVGTPYNQALSATGGVRPLHWTVSPDLPADLTLDANTGAITGTPAAASASKPYTFKATDSATPPSCASVTINLALVDTTTTTPAPTTTAATSTTQLPAPTTTVPPEPTTTAGTTPEPTTTQGTP